MKLKDLIDTTADRQYMHILTTRGSDITIEAGTLSYLRDTLLDSAIERIEAESDELKVWVACDD